MSALQAAVLLTAVLLGSLAAVLVDFTLTADFSCPECDP